ncbi:MAG: alpha/beta fold hydrolase [Microthrixaceae bacterium]
MSTNSRNVVNGDLTINYLTQGDHEDPPILMIMGLGAQRVSWPPEFIERLVDRNRFVVTFDNRDAGESTHLDDAEIDLGELLGAMMTGQPPENVPYTLSDMAGDAVAVLDAVGLDRAHVVGASMGGMIAQTLVIEHPERVLSLTSVFSNTGEGDIGGPSDEAAAALVTPVPEEREAYLAATAERWKIWSAPEHWDEAAVRDRLVREYDRSFDPASVPRQLAAIMASGSRAEALAGVTAPTLVIHGLLDTLIQPDGGRRTAELVPGATLLEIPDMGHELPEVHWDVVLDAVEAHTDS